MRLLEKLQRRFGRFAVPHVTEGLIACQALTYFFCQSEPAFLERIALVPRRVLEGEVWRLFTFVCQPPPMNLVFALFFWYMFYLMGTALENTWGTFRYNVYLLVGWLATVSVSFLQPDAPASIGFLQGSVFLAFAYLYPDFQLLLFFILPVKVKWLALLQWIGYFYADDVRRLDDATAGVGVGVQLLLVLLARHPVADAGGAVADGSAGPKHPPGQHAPPYLCPLRRDGPERPEDELPLLLEVHRRALLLCGAHSRASAFDSRKRSPHTPCADRRLRIRTVPWACPHAECADYFANAVPFGWRST